MATLRAALAAASLATVLAPALASAGPDPQCRLLWEKPTVGYDENGVPRTVTVERPQWVC